MNVDVKKRLLPCNVGGAAVKDDIVKLGLAWQGCRLVDSCSITMQVYSACWLGGGDGEDNLLRISHFLPPPPLAELK